MRDDRLASSGSPDAYAEAMMTAIDAAHRRARGVVAVLAPIDTAAQQRNRDALGARLARVADEPWLRVVDLSDETDLYDPSLRLDGFSFGAAATSLASRAIAPAFLQLISSR